MIAWADDLAIPILAESNETLLTEIQKTFHLVEEGFASFGFSLNLSKGKTEVVPTFVGQGARAHRQDIQARPRLVLEDGRHLQINGVYKHLGTFAGMAGSLEHDLRVRIAEAWRTFAALKKNIFLDPGLQLKTRLQLLDSLIFSRHFFAAGAWDPLGPRQLRRLEHVCIQMYRTLIDQVANARRRQVWTDDQVRNFLEVPTTRIRLGGLRLLYAARLFQHGPSFLGAFLHNEKISQENEWCRGLRADLAWFRATVDTSAWGNSFEDFRRRGKKESQDGRRLSRMPRSSMSSFGRSRPTLCGSLELDTLLSQMGGTIARCAIHHLPQQEAFECMQLLPMVSALRYTIL